MQHRMKIALDYDWQFLRDRVACGWFADGGGEAVDLPHCWNEQDAFQEGVAYYRGWGSYRRSFRLEDAGDVSGEFRWLLVSEGFYGTGDVWLNGKRLGKVDGQYLGFTFDVTNVLREGGENLIGVRLTNRCASYVLPGLKMPDFLLYGGLSGRMWLERVPAVRIDAGATRVEGREQAAGRWDVRIDSVLTGALTEGDALSWRVLDADGGEVGGRGSFGDPTDCTTLSVDAPRLWDVDDPCLYVAEGTLSCDGAIVDVVSIRFGFRSAEFRPHEGFFLNGRRLQLRGCNRHESMPGFGRALPLWLHREDAERIKSMGLNFVRLSHYPQHPAFLDACDELGILVYAEVASWKSVRGGRWLKKACRQMHDMILRDRNRPAVILWGMGNEGRHRGAYEKLYALCKTLDPDRAVTYAENHLHRAKRKRTLGLPDVWGINYEFDAMDEGCEASRLKCVVVSECSNYPLTERGNPDAELKQLETVQADLAMIANRPSVAGFTLWCFNDYATLRKERYKRYSGIVDAWRTPKRSARWLAGEFGGTLVSETPPCSGGGGVASSIILTPERDELNAAERETMGIRVSVLCAEGQCRGWEGVLHAVVEGPARLRSYDAQDSVVVAAGTGRLFVTATGEVGTIRVVLTGKHLPEGELTIEVT
jgi:beta-galactosidase/beta-glucuronidase